MRILVIDDDAALVQALVTHLIAQRYVVDVALDGKTGWDFVQAATYDLVVLDVNLPDISGIDLCQKFRRNRYTCPILLLTAKGDSTEKVMGLDAGADDYVVKPCTFEEICARIRALLRRQSSSGIPVLTWGKICLDPSTCLVTYNEEPLTLSPKEYGLLELFLRNPQRIFNSSFILERLWAFEDTPSEETVRTHVKRLRRRLKAAGGEDIIETIYGMGYRLRTPEQDPSLSAEQVRMAAAEAWERLKGPVLERLAVLDQAVTALQQGALSPQLQQEARQAAHKMAGSLGMFGFPDGSKIGRDLEECLQKPLNPDQRMRVPTLVARLHQELERSPLPLQGKSSARFSGSPLNVSDQRPLLLIVDDDRTLIGLFQEATTRFNMAVEVAASVAEARLKIAEQIPDVVVLDLSFPGSSEGGLVLLEELSDRFPRLPILIFTANDDFSDRLAAAHRSKHHFFSKAVQPTQILAVIQDCLKFHTADTITVLAVDDDVLVLDRLRECLPSWGIDPVTLSDSSQFWETLKSTAPDLLILDVDMPNINGIELCRVVRSDNNWNDLPILFLSSRQDADTIYRIYDAGADDYIPKPFTEPELVSRIFNRLERNQLLRSLAETDQLTGAASRRQAIKELERYLNLTKRYHQPLCIVIVDLDHFKQINDSYGHAMGDRVLRRVVQIFQQLLRSEDIVARWGGEEFLIGMYGITKQQAKERINQLLMTVKQEIFMVSESATTFHISFSAGIAEAPQDAHELDQLCQLVDIALYQAKDRGRDQIVCA